MIVPGPAHVDSSLLQTTMPLFRGLLVLPPELLLSIFQHIDPPDLFSLGQTCGRIRSLASNRHLWESALKTTCRLNQLFEPSYHPIAALSLAEVQSVALGPWSSSDSFASLSSPYLGHGSSSPQVGHPPPRRQRIWNMILLCEWEDNTEMQDICVVPGGRYVLGSTETLVCIWDLGQNTGSPLGASANKDGSMGRYDPVYSPVPAHLLHAPTGSMIWSMSEPTPVGSSSFRFVTGQNSSFCVYEVGPLPSDCYIRRIATLFLAPTLSLDDLWIQGDRLFIQYREGLLVWDFILSTYVAVPTRGDVSMITTRGDFFVAWEGLNTGVWSIPPLRPLPPDKDPMDLPELTSPVEFINGIDFNLILNEGLDHRPACRIRIPSPWYSFPSNAVEFIFLCEEDAEQRVSIERYIMNITSGEGIGSPSTLISSSHPIPVLLAPEYEGYRTLCGSLAATVTTGLPPHGEVRAIHSVGDGFRSRPKGAGIVDKVRYGSQGIGVVGAEIISYCPGSGRVACVPINADVAETQPRIICIGY
ncbi:hypothetical protein D9611_010654 [Ephemerocybe angulata]|uniref:F-box domain-containing protein n=1 Tax=Ephemerocybe angulata TaxID=980116 RepID=A0A8H5FAW6_9AGAR|nr:hypothetical protein D9611_010654 [Tulosesus angulatus]